MPIFLQFICIIFVVILFPIFQISADSSEDTYFIATAYYSPLPDQSRYSYSSYLGRYRTFQEEKRLQGEGHTTASGKGVFQGLLAGPSNYPFGTKIYFEGYGVGVIEDRGGAIRKAGGGGKCQYDCIDIWMGYGDEGLERAKKWGVRKVKGKLVIPSTTVTLKLGESPLGNLRKLQVNPDYPNSEDVKELQEILKKAGLYSDTIDGDYQSIKDILIDFQLQHKIISSKSELAAGWYGPKTIGVLKKVYGGSVETLVTEDPKIYSQTKNPKASSIYKLILEYGNLKVNPDSQSDDIYALQDLLTKLGEYTGELNGKYSSIEADFLLYQKKIGLIEKDSDWGAGYFGNKTKSAMWRYYETLYDTNGSETSFPLLDSKEKKQLKQVVANIRKRYQNEEQQGKPSLLKREEALKKTLHTAKSRVHQEELKEKISYILYILNTDS